jgi:hypothetical protein
LEEKITNEEKLPAQLPVSSVQMIDIARKQGCVTVAQAVKLTGALCGRTLSEVGITNTGCSACCSNSSADIAQSLKPLATLPED